MSARGNCYDNATCESFFASLKAEAFPDGGRFDSKHHAKLTIFEYLETFYNRSRRHSSLGNISPEQFLEQHPLNQNQQLN
jgi:transposase InsO family protein